MIDEWIDSPKKESWQVKSGGERTKDRARHSQREMETYEKTR
jgi:hypothetical protein